MATTKKTIRICIADDHKLFINSLSLIFKYVPNDTYDFDVVYQCQDITSLFEALKDKTIDIFLIDLGFEGTIGNCGVVKECLDRAKNINIVVCSMCSDLATIDKCYHYGVKGFVEKKENEFQHIVDAIITVKTGKYYFSPGMAEKLATFGFTNPLRNLTESQQEFVQLTIEGYTKSEIAAVLGVSIKTLEKWSTHDIKSVVGVTPSHYKSLSFAI